jgi:hypothetical protein
MSRNRDKTEFTTDNLRAKAAIFRQWAAEIDELSDQLEKHNIHNVELRFESNLSIGLEKVLSWVYDAKKSVSSMMFHGELPTRFAAVAEPATKYSIESEYEARSAEAQRKAAALAKPKSSTSTTEKKPKKQSG